MSLGKLLRGAGSVIKVAGPALAGFTAGGPAGAALAVVGQVAGGAEKRRGQEAERTHRRPPFHKATAPAAAVAVPAGVAALASQFGLDLSGGLGVLCPSGQLTAAGTGFLMGVLALLAHLIGHGIQDATRSRR